MGDLTQRLKERFFRTEGHPYREFERNIDARISDGQTIVDAGCGSSAEVLRRYTSRSLRLIGVDLVEFDLPPSGCGLELYNVDLANIPLDSGSVDLVFSRSVFGHLEKPTVGV